MKEGEHTGKTVPAFEVKATAPIRSSTCKDAQAPNARVDQSTLQ